MVAVVTGLLFVLALFIAPLIGAIPAAATAPALVVVGAMMISAVAGIDWDNAAVGVPAFLTLITIPSPSASPTVSRSESLPMYC